MKPITLNLTVLSLLPLALLSFSSCSTEPKQQGVGYEVIQPGQAGGVRVQTYKETATVTGIDKATRKVTLVTKDGTKSTVKCGPDVANFAQIEVGDQVKAIDLKHRRATLLFPDGTSHTFTVRPDVDMTKHAVGDEVVIRATEAVAISVEKP